MMRQDDEFRMPVQRYYTCINEECTWFRDLIADPKKLDDVIVVPNLGKYTYKDLAAYDVLHHNCEKHAIARARMKEITSGTRNRRNRQASGDLATPADGNLQASSLQ